MILVFAHMSTDVVANIVIKAGATPTVFMFAHFSQGTRVRQILSSVTGWSPGDTVRVFENGHTGQNPFVFVFLGNSMWAPTNVNPLHLADSAYKVTRSATSSQNIFMSVQAAGTLALPIVRNCTLGAGFAYIRKSSNALNVYSPMAMRLNNIVDSPDSTVTIMYA